MTTPRIYVGHDLRGQKPLHVTLSRHALTVAGSGAGKGSCQIVPNLLEWPGSAVVTDPKGEAANLTALHRRDALGQEVVVFDPFNYADVPPEMRKTFNPLDLVDSFEAIMSLGNGLVYRAENEREPHWNDGAQTLLEGVIALVKSSPNIPAAQKNLITVVSFLRQLKDKTPVSTKPQSRLILPGMPAPAPAAIPPGTTVADMAKAALNGCTAYGGLAQEAVAFLAETGESSSFFTNLSRQTKWLRSPRMQAFLGGSSPVDLRQLKHGRMTVYLVLPPNYLKLFARFLRVFTSLCLDLMWQKMPDGSQLGTRCLFLLDEFPALGKMDSLPVEALPLGRSYGLHVWPFCQQWGQLCDVYGEDGANAFLGAADAFCAYGLDDPETPKLISEQMGRVSVDDVASDVRFTLYGRPAAHPQARLEGLRLDTPREQESFRRAKDGNAPPSALDLSRRDRNQKKWIGSIQAEITADERARRRAEDWQAEKDVMQSVLMARVGSPRMAPEQIAQQVMAPPFEIAREMLVRLRGNNWVRMKPRRFDAPPPPEPAKLSTKGWGIFAAVACSPFALAGLASLTGLGDYDTVGRAAFTALLVGLVFAVIAALWQHWRQLNAPNRGDLDPQSSKAARSP